MTRRSFFIITLLTYSFLSAQDMSEGFSMLENGEFKQAEKFFEAILTNDPANKTGQICYGRALGLSGNPQKSIAIFNDLLSTYPSDQEVLLNKAEAFLWMKDGSSAIAEYQTILSINEHLFPAILGAANSYSMLGEYEKSYAFIVRALDEQPSNAQAKISAKYIRLGYANQLASEEQDYDKALELVNQNLEENPQDQESLSLLANIHLILGKYEKAQSIYTIMNNSLNGLLGESVSLHLLGKNKEALIKAQQSFELKNLTDEEKTRRSTHKVSALLWNNLLKEAREYIDSLVLMSPSNIELIASQAEVCMYEADFEKGIESYSAYLKGDSSSFKGNLGRADAYHALGLDKTAYNYAFETLGFYPGQKDVKGFIGRLNQQHSPKVSSAYTLGKASDGSSFTLWSNHLSMSLSPTLSASASYDYKDFLSTTSETMTFAAALQLNKKWKASASFGSLKINNPEQSPMYRSDIDLSIQYRVNKAQNLTVSYQNEVQDFNEQLLNQNLKTTHFLVKNAMYWKANGIGSYTEIYKSFISDGNSRNLLFTSFYKNFNMIPQVKAGFNFLNMSFKDQLPEAYFSPENYKQVEAFSSLSYAGKKLPFSINMDLAAGIQSLNGQKQNTWRTKLVIEKSVRRFDFSLSGAYSSIAATQSNGFSFSQISGKVIWRISEKPIFYNKLSSN